MKRKFSTMSFLFIALLLAGNVLAQSNGQIVRNKFMNEYEKTQEVINRARVVQQQTQTEKGKALLDLAILVQNSAHEFGQRAMYVRALEYTLKAREQARAVLAISLQAEENENLVLRQLEKTDNLIDQIQNRITPDVPRMYLRLFDSARDNQNRAWEFYRNNELRPALKMSRQAEKSIRGLLEKFKAEQGPLHRLRNQWRQLEQKMEQAQNMIADCDSDEAGKLMEKARDRMRECERMLNDGQADQAEGNMNTVQQMFRQAYNLCAGQGSLEKKMNQLKGEVDRYLENAVQNGNAEAGELMNKARQHLREAERLCNEGNVEACAANIKAAQMNVNKAKELLES
nr:hypothetical protein [candidate division Zixibacteria bacterium]